MPGTCSGSAVRHCQPSEGDLYEPVLTFLRRPAISPGAGTAHQHCPLSVAQAGSLEEGLDGLLVVDDGERARPVRGPQAAIETPGIKQAGKRIPDVPDRLRLQRQHTL